MPYIPYLCLDPQFICEDSKLIVLVVYFVDRVLKVTGRLVRVTCTVHSMSALDQTTQKRNKSQKIALLLK